MSNMAMDMLAYLCYGALTLSAVSAHTETLSAMVLCAKAVGAMVENNLYNTLRSEIFFKNHTDVYSNAVFKFM